MMPFGDWLTFNRTPNAGTSPALTWLHFRSTSMRNDQSGYTISKRLAPIRCDKKENENLSRQKWETLSVTYSLPLLPSYRASWDFKREPTEGAGQHRRRRSMRRVILRIWSVTVGKFEIKSVNLNPDRWLRSWSISDSLERENVAFRKA